MKIRYPFVIGLFIIIVPILVGQVMKEKLPTEVPTKKTVPKVKFVNPFLERLLVDYEEKIVKLSEEAHTPGSAIVINNG